MRDQDLAGFYRDYIDCLNRRDWPALGGFVADEVRHNGNELGLAGYRVMLEQNVRDIPDLRFAIVLLVCDAERIASRLWFDCTPTGSFLGLAIDGRRVGFAENVFYEIRNGKIAEVWSVLDKVALEAQLGPNAGPTPR